MKHVWVKTINSDGEEEVDTWQLDEGFHNGPKCMRCHQTFCHHCNPECYDEECE